MLVKYNDPFIDFIPSVWKNWFSEDPVWSKSNYHIDQRQETNVTEKEITVELDVPGFKKENVDIEVKGKQLNITAKTEDKSRSRVLNKRYTLPYEVDLNKSVARLEDGVLILTLQRSEQDLPQKLLLK